MNHSIGLVAILVRDYDEALRFCVGILGFQLIEDLPVPAQQKRWVLLTSSDYDFLGWTPRYLVNDLLKAISEKPSVAATVVRVNPADVPANRRVLVELTGTLPAGLQPMSADEFQPLVPPAATH